MALSNLQPTPTNLGVTASGPSGGTLLQGGALPPITTTGESATSAPQFYMCYLNQIAQSGQQAAQNAQYVGAQPLQNQAFGMIGQQAGAYQPTLNAGINAAANVAGSCLAQMAQGYMNPYTKCVVNAIGNLGQANIAQNLAPQATAGIVGSGQFGSQRGAGALGQVLANADLAITGQQACALQKGYVQALCTAKAQTANQLNASRLFGCLANAQSNLGIACSAALAKLGCQQQTIAQNQQLFPMSQLTNEAQLLRGFNIPTATSCTKTAPIPGAYATAPLAQVAGLGTLTKAVLGCQGISGLSKYFGSNASGMSCPNFYTTGAGAQTAASSGSTLGTSAGSQYCPDYMASKDGGLVKAKKE